MLKTAYDLSVDAVLQEFGWFEDRKVFLIESDRGMRVVKLHSSSAENTRSALTLQMMRRLIDLKTGAVPEIFPTKAGADFVEEKGVFLYLMEYIPTAPIEPCASEDWWKLGEAAAKLNQIRTEPLSYAIPLDPAIQEIGEWARGQGFEKPVRDLLGQLNPLLEDREMGVIHGEINPANAGKRADGGVVLLDWDDAGTGQIALELGYPLITQFLQIDTHEFMLDQARAYFSGYQSVSPIPCSPDAVFASALFHALRYMRFADVERRWQRIRYAVEHRTLLLSALGEI